MIKKKKKATPNKIADKNEHHKMVDPLLLSRGYIFFLTELSRISLNIIAWALTGFFLTLF
jgi:hypothetical protein